MKFLAVTACPSGVAHTYMAAEAIQQACEKQELNARLKHRVQSELKIRLQRQIGIENQITKADVESADAVILTTDMPIKNVERFDNLKKVKIGISPAIKQADAIVAKMISMLNA
ncbi:PTS fructose transporter subunit IIB [Parabacteroides distasonis]|nr:PTS fructose transporter subunit IIB [Parabacteroides distasonis]